VSIDGFSWEYLEKKYYPTPIMDAFREKGVTAKLHPQFPTKTFPNHYSIITGLIPESHGIVGNIFYDPIMNSTFRLSDAEIMKDPRWWGGDPLWNLANRSGLITASYYWPGSETLINGGQPTYFKKYNASVPAIKRVEQVLSWLDLPSSRRPSFITMYFSDVDTAGHRYGPDNINVAAAVAEIDASLGTLFYGISARQSVLDIQTVVVSDHGMQSIAGGVLLDRYLTQEQISACLLPDINTPSVNIFVEQSRVNEIYSALRNMTHAKAYLKADIPAQFNFRRSERIAPILVIADIGYLITTTDVWTHYPALLTGGSHGWDPIHPNMTGIFLAKGSSFQPSSTVHSFQNTEVHNLLAKILGLSPLPNNGTVPFLPGILAPEKTKS
jgi:predicted AlkP superfamily pyrophosphatase or phosphodiesterase